MQQRGTNADPQTLQPFIFSNPGIGGKLDALFHMSKPICTNIPHQHYKFIATKAAGAILFTNTVLQKQRESLQNLIAEQVSVSIVKIFKIIQIDHQHSQTASLLPDLLHFLPHQLQHSLVIIKTGQVILYRLIPEFSSHHPVRCINTESHHTRVNKIIRNYFEHMPNHVGETINIRIKRKGKFGCGRNDHGDSHCFKNTVPKVIFAFIKHIGTAEKKKYNQIFTSHLESCEPFALHKTRGKYLKNHDAKQ